MIFFKHSLITFTTLSVAIWVMPFSSGIETDDKVFANLDPNIVTLRGMKLFINIICDLTILIVLLCIIQFIFIISACELF